MTHMAPLVALVAILATYRLTLLVTADHITEPWRDAIIGRYVHRLHDIVGHGDGRGNEWGTRPPGVPAGQAWSACRCGTTWVSWERGSTDPEAEAIDHVAQHPEHSTGPRWLMLLDCQWCASMWIAAPVAWSAWCFGGRSWWFVPAFMLAASACTGALAQYAKP